MSKKNLVQPPIIRETVTVYKDSWTPFWCSIGVIVWLFCGLIHYQIARGEQQPLVNQDGTCVITGLGANSNLGPNYYRVACDPSNSTSVSTVPTWTKGKRAEAIFLGAFGPIALFIDWSTGPHNPSWDEKASW